MIDSFKNSINEIDKNYLGKNRDDFEMPTYDGKTHYKEIAKYPYFQALTVLRHFIKRACETYWGDIQKAYNVDLFMITQSVSSPMGPGSDSESISIKFGKTDAYLVDSAQFGLEPLLMNEIKKVYCYLPSMRGEDPDYRHLNQFYHCEAEISGTLEDLKPQIEVYVKFLAETLLSMPNILRLLSTNLEVTTKKLTSLTNQNKFINIEFDEVLKTLKEAGFGNLINETNFGSDVSAHGEIKLMEILKTDNPIWVNHFHRSRVPFYQKPFNGDNVINADLLFPPIIQNTFGGEIVGSGQRQDDVSEIYESLNRQGLDPKPYEWYIDLRRLENYKTTSGFGLGIERFIAWALCKEKIQDVILYPRLKNTVSFP